MFCKSIAFDSLSLQVFFDGIEQDQSSVTSCYITRMLVQLSI